MIYTLENDILCVQVNSMGAELWSVLDKRDQTEHLWQGDPKFWPRRAPNLFPWCGRLKNGRYLLEGGEYQGELHGFARNCEHTLLSQESATLVLSLCDSEDTKALYPFSFSLSVVYLLNDNRLTCRFQVENRETARTLPFSIGYHTGYLCPFDEKHTIEDYRLVFEKNETVNDLLTDENGLMSGQTRPYLTGHREIALHNKLFPSSFVLEGLDSSYVGIVENETGREVRVHCPDFPYVVFWSTAEQVPFICIEPWHGLPDNADTDGNFLNKPGLRTLQPGERFSCEQEIEIIKKA